MNYAIYRTRTNQLQKYTRNIFLITKFASNISNSANPELPSHGLTAAIEMLIGHGWDIEPHMEVTWHRILSVIQAEWKSGLIENGSWLQLRTTKRGHRVASPVSWLSSTARLPSLWPSLTQTLSPMSWQLVLLKAPKRQRMPRVKAMRRLRKRFWQLICSAIIASILRLGLECCASYAAKMEVKTRIISFL